MREIKFRAWSEEDKKMSQSFSLGDLYGYEGECNDVQFDGDGPDKLSWSLCSHNSSGRDGWIGMAYPQMQVEDGINKDLILMQYTGLKDKNGKEIYEGDIVRVGEHYEEDWKQIEIVGVVEFENGAYWVADKKTNVFNVFRLNSYDATLEVIGNIYENPNLLNKQNDKSKQIEDV